MTEPESEVFRDRSPHEVQMSEHSKVAVSKTGDAGAPSVRKVLANPEAEVSESRPQEHRLLVPESAHQADTSTLVVPAPLLGSQAAALTIPEDTARPLAGRLVAPEKQALADHLVDIAPEQRQIAPDLAVPAGAAQAARVLGIPAGDTLDAPLADIPASESAAGRLLDIPASEALSAPTLDIPQGDRDAPPELALSAGDASSARLDATAIKALLSELNVPVSETAVAEQLGGPGPAWVEMDYPARVVKLKIENDKVRDKLDTLERAMGSAR